MKILVTGAGGPAGISVIKILNQQGHDVFAADMSAYSAGLFLVDEERRFVIPAGSRIGFVDSIITLCRAQNIELVIPTVDAELIPLSIHAEIFRAMGVHIATSSLATLQRTLDKWSLQCAVEGKPVHAKTQVLDAAFREDEVSFPVVIKPRTGSGSRGVRILHHAAELDEYPRNGKMIVQEYLPGREFSVDVFCHQGRVLQGSARARVKINGGIAVISQTVCDDALVEGARMVCETMGVEGAANVQFKLDADGNPKLLEINPRFPGGTSLTQEAGMDWVGATVSVAAGEVPILDQPIREIAMVRRYEEQYIEPGVIEDVPMTFQPFELGNLVSANWD